MFEVISELNSLVTFTVFETIICWSLGTLTGIGLGAALGRNQAKKLELERG
jgi:hypothetical protein